jgi:hypothetical protein
MRHEFWNAYVYMDVCIYNQHLNFLPKNQLFPSLVCVGTWMHFYTQIYTCMYRTCTIWHIVKNFTRRLSSTFMHMLLHVYIANLRDSHARHGACETQPADMSAHTCTCFWQAGVKQATQTCNPQNISAMDALQVAITKTSEWDARCVLS